MTLPGAILFPQSMLPLYIFEPRYRQMLADALNSHRMFSVAMQKPGRSRETPCAIAGLGLIRASVSREDGTSNLILQGIARVELGRTIRYKPYRVQRIHPLAANATDSVAIDALKAKVLELVSERLEQGFELSFPALKKLGLLEEEGGTSGKLTLQQGIDFLSKLQDAEQIADLVAWTLLASPLERQLLLETADLETRLKHLIHFLMAEIHRHKKDKNS